MVFGVRDGSLLAVGLSTGGLSGWGLGLGALLTFSGLRWELLGSSEQGDKHTQTHTQVYYEQ